MKLAMPMGGYLGGDTLFDKGPVTPEERAAVEVEPRAGVWFEAPGLPKATAAELSPEETDQLINAEIRTHLPWSDARQADELFGPLRPVEKHVAGIGVVRVREQRGGIHSDKLARLMAVRAWGLRDVRWFDDVIASLNGHFAFEALELVDADSGMLSIHATFEGRELEGEPFPAYANNLELMNDVIKIARELGVPRRFLSRR